MQAVFHFFYNYNDGYFILFYFIFYYFFAKEERGQ
jgi:hypothetical protein